MMIINEYPNYCLATNAAYRILLRYNIENLPIDLNLITQHLTDLKIKTYDWYSKTTGCNLSEIYDCFDEYGCINYNPKTDTYLLLYNDLKSQETIRFTIAHELGHYFLKHRQHSKVNDKEANCFARNILSPVPVIDMLKNGCNTNDLYFVFPSIFYISELATEVRFKLLSSDSYYIFDKFYKDIQKQFEVALCPL